MRRQAFALLFVIVSCVLGSPAWADDEDPPPAAPEPTEPAPPADEPKADEPKADEPKADEPKADEPKADEPKADEPKADVPDEPKPDEPKADEPGPDGGARPELDDESKPGAAASAEDAGAEDDGISDNPVDADGDGEVTADEVAAGKTFDAAFADVPNDVDEAALDRRDEAAELVPSMTEEHFRTLVAAARGVVLEKMAKKIAAKTDQRMRNFSWFVAAFSLVGVLLLAMPLVLRRRYPGQGKLLFKYSALAAVTFVVTVNLFGAVLYGMRTVQSALAAQTNPSIAIAVGTFESLDKNAEEYLTTGKELFAPTLEQMRAHPETQPSVALLDNASKLLGDVKVFRSIASTVKQVDFLFGVLPILLMAVTMLLFVLAIRPTLTAIVRLPIDAAARGGSVGKEVVGGSLRRVKGELLATLCTVGVLTVLTLVSAFILGRTVRPALETFLSYFSAAVSYLQFVDGASTGTVYLALLGVIVFLVLNLAVLILSMSFFLGKTQKIFQARFNEGTPVAAHRRFFQWGVPSVLFAQLFPLLFVFFADFLLGKINDAILDGVTDAEQVAWGKLMLAGPLTLVVAFAVLFWAARGVKALKFLATYKVKRPEDAAAGAPGS